MRQYKLKTKITWTFCAQKHQHKCQKESPNIGRNITDRIQQTNL